jgi:putative tryptophan/tyrosine transport system substrate-binding protein
VLSTTRWIAVPMQGTAGWRGFLIGTAAVALSFLGAPIVEAAQPSAKVYRIGWLGHGSAPSGPDRSAGEFQLALRDVGYVEGRNLVIEYRFANGNVERLPELAAELVRLPVDVIVTSGEPAALAAKQATKSIPIVATEFGLDPIKAGLVSSLGRPDANVTGMATLSEDLWQKRLGLLREIAPKISRLAVLWNPGNPGNASCAEEIKAAAPTMGMQLRFLEVRDAKTLEQAFAGIARDPPGALVTCWDSVTLANAKPIADLALKLRLPSLAPLREYVQAGGLLSFGTSLSAHRRRAAYYVDKILKGTKPADLPVERPTLFELIVNLTTAKTLGLVLPAVLTVAADELIE